ncbi:uncharacterized protein [Euphorbia lathyris]|uniref:uncharacterized protein n=1 Tax=Euphorbia lathyris TaxID=212925 RepID=UPI003313E40E
MVSLSLYRGNLHRVPDVPRRWLMPTRAISFKDFKSLLHRRSKALSRLHSSTGPITTTSNPSPNPNPNPNSKENGIVIAPPLEDDKGANRFGEGTSKSAAPEQVKDQETFDCGESTVKAGDVSNSSPVEKHEVAEKGNEHLHSIDPHAETSSKADTLGDKEKRKREVEEKLEALSGKKHNLVQMLKQILNVEEELKRHNNSQGMANRSPVSPQVDMSNDSGSMSRHPTPRIGSEPHIGVDMEGRENEDVSNHNNYPRLIHQTSSTSPSSESPLRRPPYIQHNMVLHPSRPSLGMTSSPSPSRFAPTGHLGPPSTVPTVSVSGTNYVASSPSPAASGGTSSFRDVRQPSPWN